MQPKFLILTPMLAGLSACSEDIQARDTAADVHSEAPSSSDAEGQPDSEQGQAEPELKLQRPVGLD